MVTISDFIADNTYERLLATNSSGTDNLEAPIEDGGPGGLLVLPLVMFFFLVWNGFLGAHTTLAFSMLFRGKCDESVMILLCPHWLVGILIPILIGYESFGVLGALGLGFVDVILPYSFWAVYHDIYNEDVRAISCCSCFRANTLEVPVGSADVATESDDSKILILKKVVNQGDLLVEKDDAKSFRFNHPKSDLVIQRQPKSSRLNNKKCKVVTPSSNVSTNSVQLCAICLDDYKVGEDIGWSRNPLCHHVFHTDCILKSLEANNLCPICRNSYYIADDEEMGHDPPDEGPN
jgi:hypothetical protein